MRYYPFNDCSRGSCNAIAVAYSKILHGYQLNVSAEIDLLNFVRR